VQATIGFRERPGGDAGAMTCADFHEDKPGEQPSPLERERAGLTAFDSRGKPVGVERVVDLGGHIGWSPSFRGHVRLPCPVSRVEVELAHSAKAPRVTARNADGNEIATAVMTTTGPETIVLSGSGYRSHDRQVELRQAHCGTSHFAIYHMPASQCSPPTARPGKSMHEVGLAIDFDNCSSHATRCWHWLAANASRFGFFNLPTEPWHWSIDGS
jgi:hypothetical protein